MVNNTSVRGSGEPGGDGQQRVTKGRKKKISAICPKRVKKMKDAQIFNRTNSDLVRMKIALTGIADNSIEDLMERVFRTQRFLKDFDQVDRKTVQQGQHRVRLKTSMVRSTRSEEDHQHPFVKDEGKM